MIIFITEFIIKRCVKRGISVFNSFHGLRDCFLLLIFSFPGCFELVIKIFSLFTRNGDKFKSSQIAACQLCPWLTYCSCLIKILITMDVKTTLLVALALISHKSLIGSVVSLLYN